jgi:hypothetical protein
MLIAKELTLHQFINSAIQQFFENSQIGERVNG